MQAQAMKIEVSSFDLSKAITFSKMYSKIKLSASARQVLRCLVDFYNPKKGLVYPGQNTIAECTGVGLRSVNSAIDELRTKGLILTTGKTGEKLKYYFSAKFFELVKIALPCAKTAQDTYAKIAQHEQKKPEQINNNSISYNFKNRNEYASDWRNKQQTDGLKLPSAVKTLEQYKKDKETAVTPLDFSKEQQIEYYNKLPEFARNGFYAKEIKKRWNL